jgi:hypothetical protein
LPGLSRRPLRRGNRRTFPEPPVEFLVGQFVETPLLELAEKRAERGGERDIGRCLQQPLVHDGERLTEQAQLPTGAGLMVQALRPVDEPVGEVVPGIE